MRKIKNNNTKLERNTVFRSYEEYQSKSEEIWNFATVLAMHLVDSFHLRSKDYEDVISEVKLRCEKYWHKIPCARGLKAYLRRIVYHAVYDMKKHAFPYVRAEARKAHILEAFLPKSDIKKVETKEAPGRTGHLYRFEGHVTPQQLNQLENNQTKLRVIVLFRGIAEPAANRDESEGEAALDRQASDNGSEVRFRYFSSDLESLLRQIGKTHPRWVLAFRLCEMEGLSTQEAAKAMGIGTRAVNTNILRCKKALRESPELLDYVA